MTYLSGSKNNKKGNLARIIGGIFCVAFLSYMFMPNVYDLISKFYSSIPNFSFGSKDDNELQVENNKLSREVLELRAQVDAYEIFNTSIGSVSDERLNAKVLKRPPNTLFDTVLIDRGRIDGVDKEMLVYTGNTSVGKIKEVFERASVVELDTNPNNSNQAVFKGGKELEIKGIGNGAFEAFVPKDIDISVGDTVFATDRKATLFGIIEHIEDKEGSVYRRVFIDSPFKLYKESWVEIQTK